MRRALLGFILLALFAVQAPSTGDGWCEDDTTCEMVFGGGE